MKVVNGFPQCKETISGKFIWNTGDPINGVDVPAWKQKSDKIECGDDEECVNYCRDSYNGEYVNGRLEKRCYSYQVKSIF